MSGVLRALARALPLMADRRVLLLVVAPLVAALCLWFFAAIAFGAPLAHAFAGLIARAIAAMGLGGEPGAFATAGGAIAAFLLLSVAAGVLALTAIAIFAGPVFVRVVEARHYPALEKKEGGTAAGGAANAIVALTLWLPMALAVLPFLLFPPVGLPLSLAVNAWLNQRLFRYDALAVHASREERHAILRSARVRLFGLGLVLSPLSLVPFVNLAAPLYAGLAFTCLCLAELDALRRTPAGDEKGRAP